MGILPYLRFSVWDIIGMFFWHIVLWFVVQRIRRQYKDDLAVYELLPWIWGWRWFLSIGVVIAYQYYYLGGDTINYFRDAKVTFELLLYEPWDTLRLLRDTLSGETPTQALEKYPGLMHLIYTASYAVDMYGFGFWIYGGDSAAFFVVILTIPFVFLGMGSFYATTTLVAFVAFLASLRLYRTFSYHFPESKKILLGALGFLPSYASWASAIFKETYAIIGMSFFLYTLMYPGRKSFLSYLLLPAWGYVIYQIKPYILLSFLPFLLLWLSGVWQQKIPHALARVLLVPLITVVSAFLAYSAVVSLGEGHARYDIDKIWATAHLVQSDLQRDAYYQATTGSRYDIGEWEPTFQGAMSKFPIATFTGLFRPLLWEVRNPLMLPSAVEGTLILLVFLRIIWNVGIWGMLRTLWGHPVLRFMVLFGITFVFMAGLSSGNFGNLTRYRLPGYIILVAAILVIGQRAQNQAKARRDAQVLSYRGGK
ncbi:MAG: hypothetical protein ACUVRD_08790 [Bacteroidia bacterium]